MKKVIEEKNAYQATSWAFELDPVHGYAYWEKAFSDEECDQLISVGNSLFMEKGRFGLSKEKDSKIRDSEVAWMFPNMGIEWAYQRITSVVTNLNNKFFGFDLFGSMEGFQFTKYEAPDGKYTKHIDSCTGKLIRKLSITLQLSNPADYEGGDLCLYLDAKGQKMKKDRGYIVVFPSYVLHEVKPVTKGTRYSLVCWITGKPFK